MKKVIGSGYLCIGVKQMFDKCGCVEGDWIGLVDAHGHRIKFVDNFPKNAREKKFKLIVEWEK